MRKPRNIIDGHPSTPPDAKEADRPEDFEPTLSRTRIVQTRTSTNRCLCIVAIAVPGRQSFLRKVQSVVDDRLEDESVSAWPDTVAAHPLPEAVHRKGKSVSNSS